MREMKKWVTVTEGLPSFNKAEDKRMEVIRKRRYVTKHEAMHAQLGAGYVETERCPTCGQQWSGAQDDCYAARRTSYRIARMSSTCSSTVPIATGSITPQRIAMISP